MKLNCKNGKNLGFKNYGIMPLCRGTVSLGKEKSNNQDSKIVKFYFFNTI